MSEVAAIENETHENQEPQIRRIKVRRKQEVIEVEDEAGNVHRVTLREMNGIQRDIWLNKNSKATKTDSKGNRTTDFTGLHANLICACAYTDAGLPYQQSVVQNWSSSAQEELFRICLTLNGLDKDSADAEKKS